MEDKKVTAKKRKKLIIIGVIIVLTTVVGLFYWQQMDKRQSAVGAFEIIETLQEDSGIHMGQGSFLNGLISYNKDGAVLVDLSGKIKWNQSFTMKNPAMFLRDEFVAIGDIGSNQIVILDQNGKTGEVTTAFPIETLAVAKQGVVAALLEDGTNNYIYIYDKIGNLLAKMKTSIEKDGYPIAIGLSEDGTKLVTSYLHTDGKKISTNISFYNFSEVGQEFVHKLVGGFIYEEIIPRVDFIGNDRVIGFGESKVLLYQMEHKPEIIVEKDIGDEILSVFYHKNYFGLVVSLAETKENELQVFDLKGNLLGASKNITDYKHITAASREILLFDEDTLCIYSTNGRLSKQIEFESNLGDILPTGKRNQYLMMDGGKTQLIKFN